MTGSAEKSEDFQDIDKPVLLGLSALCLIGLIYYYWPLLCGSADVYFSDLTFFFEPFCRFVRKNAEHGILALWNPLIYAGMPQVAMPSPGLLYPFSWFMFLLPFSRGLAVYMIFHQILMGVGSYLYFRDINSSRAASLFGAVAVCLCAYNFSFVRNCTLPASMAWLPLALYFERHIRLEPGRRTLLHMLGLAICVAMLMHVGRPEVGAPALLLIGFACVSNPLAHLLKLKDKGAEPGSTLRQLPIDSCDGSPAVLTTGVSPAPKAPGPESVPEPAGSIGSAPVSAGAPPASNAEWLNCILKLSALALGLALSLPTVIPGIEWTALSPRAQGLEPRWVFTWSANWFDFLGIILASPFGDLCQLEHQTMQFRKLVLSRGGHIPFLSSAYVSPLVVTLSLFGFFQPNNRLKLLSIALLGGFSLMALGNYTPFAPAFVSLSPFLAAFRYPVKLMIYPCLFLILLAVKGMDLFLQRKLPLKVVYIAAAIWGTVFIFGLLLGFFPQIGIAASHWKFLFQSVPLKDVLRDAQFLMGKSLQAASFLGLLSCWLSYLAQAGKLTGRFIAGIFVAALTVCLVQSSLVIENYTAGGFFEQPSVLATRIKQLHKGDSTAPFRVVDLFFDPLTVPGTYHKKTGASGTENFFHYARELLLFQTIMDFDLSSSYGYEAAETADYKTFFSEAFDASSQHMLIPPKKRTDKISDAPIHRFAALTATEFANTQIFHTMPKRDVPLLDPRFFELLEENRDLDFRIYKVKNSRPRAYFAGNLVFLESFKDLHKLFVTKEDNAQAQILDNSTDIVYLLNRDKQSNLVRFKPIDTAPASNHGRGNASLPGSDSVKITSDNGQEITFDIQTDSDRVLVVADHYYPGWVAELDGKAVPILKANLLNRAVLIPAGQHSLTMYYRPNSLFIGIAGAAGSLLLFLLLYFLIIKHKSPK